MQLLTRSRWKPLVHVATCCRREGEGMGEAGRKQRNEKERVACFPQHFNKGKTVSSWEVGAKEREGE